MNLDLKMNRRKTAKRCKRALSCLHEGHNTFYCREYGMYLRPYGVDSIAK